MLLTLSAVLFAKTTNLMASALESVNQQVQARAVLLVDAQTGRVIFSRNPDEQHHPASTIKLLTALVVAEETGLRGTARVNAQDIAISTPGASMANLRNGSTHSVYDLTRVLLVRSSNDVASVLAAHVAGSEASFVRQMQARARELGANSTVVRNPHGLPDSQQVTTARDLMRIFRRVIANPTLRALCMEPRASITTVNGPVTFVTTNRLLNSYAGMGPAKTGFTRSSRHTYAASATRNGRELHLVLLNSPNKWTDARVLFDYGFSVVEGRLPANFRAESVMAYGPARPAEVVRPATLVRLPDPDRVTPFDVVVANEGTQRRQSGPTVARTR